MIGLIAGLLGLFTVLDAFDAKEFGDKQHWQIITGIALMAIGALYSLFLDD